MLTVKRASSIKCVLARFVKQLSANFRFIVQHSHCPLACITRPLREREITGEVVFFALKSLLNALRIQESRHLALFDAVLAVFQPSDAQDRMRHQFGPWYC